MLRVNIVAKPNRRLVIGLDSKINGGAVPVPAVNDHVVMDDDGILNSDLLDAVLEILIFVRRHIGKGSG